MKGGGGGKVLDWLALSVWRGFTSLVVLLQLNNDDDYVPLVAVYVPVAVCNCVWVSE